MTLDLGLALRKIGRDDEARRLLERVAGGRQAPLAARAKRELAGAR